MNKKNIRPRNKQGKAHGYWEMYWSSNGRLAYKGHFDNGKPHGYWEEYNSDETIYYKGYYDNGIDIGYSEEYWDDEIRIYI